MLRFSHYPFAWFVKVNACLQAGNNWIGLSSGASMSKILLVEDDVPLSVAIKACLKADRHEIEHVTDGQTALSFIERYHFDLLVLDWDLPRLSGVEVCATLRRSGNETPILMLTGKSQIEEIEKGFDAGADDYLTKPFHKRELAARVGALVKRRSPIQPNTISFGDLLVNMDIREVRKDNVALALPAKELKLLQILLEHANQPVSLTTILNSGWDADVSNLRRNIGTHLSKLRSELKQAGSAVCVEKLPDESYVLRPAPQEDDLLSQPTATDRSRAE
jgi:two-component system, OmpR family, copper resistance phosphate regulon response regulator CusR